MNGTAIDITEGVNAAKAGDLGRLKKWLQEGNDPNQRDGEGWTPLLWAAARGHHETVRLLLDKGADSGLAHGQSGALAVHMAGHSGDVDCARALLDNNPTEIDAVWDLNGHTILLQAVFYDHQPLTRMLVVERGANTAITTARGLGPMELADQFQNQPMMEIIRHYDRPQEEKDAYYAAYLKRIAPEVPPERRAQQDLNDQLTKVIEEGIAAARTGGASVDLTLEKVRVLIEEQGAEVNGLGGPLQQPPLIAAVTGNNGFPPNPDLARLREDLAAYLMEQGADAALHEKHPMGAQTVIRAAVFNHLKILRLCGEYMSPRKLTAAINEIPIVNGLTAMHDTVLRASTAGPDELEGYLEQAAWFVANGGRVDIEDFAGVTQRNIAEGVADPERRRRLLEVLDGNPYVRPEPPTKGGWSRRPNTLKEDLAAGKVCLGATVTMNNPVVAELLSRVGYDWLWFETEHTTVPYEGVLSMLQATNGSDVSTIVRVPWNDKTMIKRVLDTGADGIIVPLVRNKTEAEEAVRAMKYPPLGERGGGLTRAQGYGMYMGPYLQTANDVVTTILMIEHIDAVNNIHEILSVKGVDSVMIGTLDLSGTMGLLGQTSHPKVEEAIQTVLAACKSAKVPCGIIAGGTEDANKRIREGFTNIIVGLDVLMLVSAAQGSLEGIQRG
jgi:2-keto-3-deoxy-L-rhamnonate aldolase RhmA